MDKIKISPYDIGLLRGYGVFDVMRTVNGKPFLLKEHFVRLKNSAKELNLKLPFSFAEYEKILKVLLKKNKFKESSIRTVLTGGEALDAPRFLPNKKLTCYILIEEFHGLPEKIFTSGAAIMTLEFERQIPVAKITNYVEAIRSHKKKKRSNCLEIIYVKNGKVSEASSSNFFIFKKGKLITTKNGILLGTTRNLVVKLAKKNKIKIEERAILEEELFSADEVFITATNKDIVPIVKIDGEKVGNGKVGENTKIMMELFSDFVKKY